MLDTNILIYAYDPADPVKHTRAQTLIVEQITSGTLIVSVQVLNEFYSRITKTTRKPSLSHEEATEIIHRIAASATVLPLTSAATLRALDAVGRYGMSFWDALIWAVAIENGVSVIHTEDTPSAPEIEGVRYVNPFK